MDVPDTKKELKRMYTDKNAYLEGVKGALKIQDPAVIEEAFKPGSLFGRLLAERDVILAEAFGPAFESHLEIERMKFMLAVHLGRLSVLQEWDEVEKVRKGE